MIPRLSAAIFIALFAFPALAQFTKDPAAAKKIDQAVNTHYLMMELDKAESALKSVIDTCGDQCSPATLARAWMYVGIVRGSGKNDLAGAGEAFATAKSLDPEVQLDKDLASPETQAAFDSPDSAGSGAAASSGGSSEPARAPEPEQKPAKAGEIPGDMNCTPATGSEIQTRTPIPISCTSDAAVESAVLKFKEYGSRDWKKIELKKNGDAFEGTIPCDVLGVAGTVLWFVGGKDAAGEYVDQFGSKKDPAGFELVENGGEALSYSDGSPVARCADKSDCPPDFPGCSTGGGTCGDLDWGAACQNSTECKCGLTCDGGTCVNAPSCSTDADCSAGTCQNGYCQAGGSGGATESSDFKKIWLSASVGLSGTFYGINQGITNTDEMLTLCDAEAYEFEGMMCAQTGQGTQYTDAALRLQLGGASWSMVPISVAFDYALSDHFQLGAQGTFVLGLIRPPLVPLRATARLTYNFTSLGSAGFRPAVFLGAGYGNSVWAIQVPAGVAPVSGGAMNPAVDVVKYAGPLFAEGGLSLGYAITPSAVIKLGAAGQIAAVTTTPLFGMEANLGFSLGL